MQTPLPLSFWCLYASLIVGLVDKTYQLCLPVKIVRPLIHCCGIFKTHSRPLTKTYIITPLLSLIIFELVATLE